MPWKPEDKEKKREYDKKWYRAHKEERKKTNHESYLKNKEHRKYQYEVYRSKNKAKYILWGASRRMIECELTESEIKEIISSGCYYCGESEKIGVDRVDNSKGYTKDNCVPCCGMCNKMKNVYSKEAFIHKCNMIANKWPTNPSDE